MFSSELNWMFRYWVAGGTPWKVNSWHPWRGAVPVSHPTGFFEGSTLLKVTNLCGWRMSIVAWRGGLWVSAFSGYFGWHFFCGVKLAGDLTRPKSPKWWFSNWNLISGKSRSAQVFWITESCRIGSDCIQIKRDFGQGRLSHFSTNLSCLRVEKGAGNNSQYIVAVGLVWCTGSGRSQHGALTPDTGFSTN